MSDSALVAQLINAGNLESLFDGDAEQLRYWYSRMSEINFDELGTQEELAAVANACRLIMQYERTNAEELRELAEREAVEAAEREENWIMEREMLKDEIRVLRDRITVKAGFDDANEAFRAEIDSLTSENALLRQQARERDRELADQRDRAEELSTRLQATERERALFAGNQTELEEQIRELNRRINVHSDIQPQRNEWEIRRLRQRNEQAIALSNQLQSVILQNEELKTEAERVTMALESATILIQEQNAKFAHYAKQLCDADAFIEQLRSDIRELKIQIAQKDASLSHSSTEVEASGRALAEVVDAKEAELNRLQLELERRELEIEELRAHLHLQQNDVREAEIERLHDELIAATEAARQLFGNAMSGDGVISADPNAELKIRIIDLDKKLHVAEEKVDELRAENAKRICELEEKDVINARLNNENKRLRQAAFGSASEEIRRLEMQINYRDRQIQELNRYCSLLQINLLEQDEKMESNKIYDVIQKKQKSGQKTTKLPTAPKRHVMFVSSPVVVEETVRSNESDNDRKEKEDEEHSKETSSTMRQNIESKPSIDQRPVKYGEIEPTITIINAMHSEILKLKEELHQHSNDVEIEKRLRSERETLLRDAKNLSVVKQREIDELKAIIYSDRLLDDINEAFVSVCGDNTAAELTQLRQRSNELELENAELRRLTENLESSGEEFERRAAEATRRIVFLAIQNARYERHIASSELIRQALAREHANVRIRLQRVLSGEERRSRQLDLENEEKLIEIARLQNMLLHCVPWAEYRRIQRAYKKIICAETIKDSNSISALDGGYHSANGEDDEDDELEHFDISIKALVAYNSHEDTRSNVSTGRWTDKLVSANRRLSEENEVRRSQCEFWESEVRKKDAEIEELNAFIADIENETELKSMLVNIERRFLRMINEQSDSVQERFLYRNEANQLRRNLQRQRAEWHSERQELVNLALHLRKLLCKVRSDRVMVSVSQLEELKQEMEAIKRRNKLLDERQKQIECDVFEFEKKSALVEASNLTNSDIINADYQLKNIQTTLQGAHLSILTLSSQLRKTQDETETWRKLAARHEARANELEKTMDDFNFTNIDLQFLDKCDDTTTKPAEEFRKIKRLSVPLGGEDSSDEFNGAELLTSDTEPVKNPSAILIDNSAEYERQIHALKNAAKLCIKTYEEQLLQKDKTIEEYQRLLENIRERPPSAKLNVAEAAERENPSRSISERPLSAQLILDSQNATEQSQRRIHILERELRSVKAANDALTDRLEEELKRAEQTKKAVINQAVQVEIKVDSTNGKSNDNSTQQLQASQYQSTESSANQGKKSSNESSQSDGEVTEPDSPESETDSGTVDDIDDDRRISSGSISSQDSTRNKSTIIIRKNNAIATRKQAASSDQNEEELVQRHRNETRRLKMRIVMLEKKIKELTDENSTIRERGRFNARPVDPNAEVNILRKQNERMHRENSNLTKSLRDRAEEIEKLKKTLKKNESINPTKLATDIWEERKRHERAQTALKQRIADLTTQEHELQERLARREKFIEQLTSENASQHNKAQRLAKLQNDWSAEKAAAAERELSLKDTVGNWMAKYHSASSRLDSLVKEKSSLYQKCMSLQNELRQIQQHQQHKMLEPSDPVKHNMSTQTTTLEVLSQNRESQQAANHQTTESANFAEKYKSVVSAKCRTFDGVNEREINTFVLPKANGTPDSIVTPPTFCISSTSKHNDSTTTEMFSKKLRKAKLLGAETAEQLAALRTSYDELLKNYKNLMNNERRRDEEITAIVVLRDKLVGKDREIEHQRHKIVELERKLWTIQMDY